MIQPPDIRFNLYWNWKIKLKSKGVEYMKTERPDLSLGDDGFLTIKGWEFIKLFGPSIKEGRSPYFENIMYLHPPPIYPEGGTEIVTINFRPVPLITQSVTLPGVRLTKPLSVESQTRHRHRF